MSDNAATDLLIFTTDGEGCALPVRTVRDVLDQVAISPVPLAPPAIAGHLNLRGRIVTAIDLAVLVGRDASNENPAARRMAIVIEDGATLYALLVDEVQEVLRTPDDAVRPVPAWVAPRWAALATGIVRHGDTSLVRLDPKRVLAAPGHAA